MKMTRQFFIKVLFIVFLLIAINGTAQEKSINLMPMPASIIWGEGKLPINRDFDISLEGSYHDRIGKEATRFLRRLDNRTGRFFHQHKVTGAKEAARLIIFIEKEGEVRLHEDESYELSVSPQRVLLRATTDIGAIRGLETLLQLVDAESGNYYFPVVEIQDQPRFAWRGLMLDVARHYMPLDVLFRNMDAMAAAKLNVLHLHLSDDQGFRFPSKAFPELIEMASDGLFYSHEELKKIIAYADQRGIRVMPEIDVPGHATAILVAYPHLGSKDTTYQLERDAGIFDPTLDPTNEQVYDFLATLFGEIAEVFPDPFFHLGGDENLGRHWDANEDIQAFMRQHDLESNHDLQTYFNIRLQKILANLGKQVMGWEEIMTEQMPKTAVIHSWKGNWEGVPPKQSLFEAARAGYETVLSNGYYVDLMLPASYHYSVDPAPADADLTTAERRRILGGEICMWSELVIPATIDSRLWPRSMAIAERLWSPEDVKDVDDMYRRLAVMNIQMEELGLQHLTARDVILRKLAGSTDIDPLKTLVELVEPMKGYTRNPGGTMYASYSPFMLWADAATADARVARQFNDLVDGYLNKDQEGDGIREQLSRWEKNHGRLLPIIEASPVLLEIEALSASLAEVATIGLEALDFLETKEFPKSGWMSASRKALEQAAEEGGRTELQIITGIARLVDQVEATAK